MTAILIRPATADDWQTIVDFNIRLAAETEHLRLDRATVEAGVQAALADPTKARYFVAVVEGRVVGQLMHTFEWSDWRNGQIWWLQSVYVHPDFRGRGVFQRLFRFLQEAGEQDPEVVGLRLYVENHNAKAQAVYERLGMREAGYQVREVFWRRAPARDT